MLTGGLWWPGLQRRGVVGEVRRRVVAELAEEVVAGRPRAPGSRESMRCRAARLEGGSAKGHRRRVIEWAGRLTPGGTVLCSGRSCAARRLGCGGGYGGEDGFSRELRGGLKRRGAENLGVRAKVGNRRSLRARIAATALARSGSWGGNF